MIMQDLFKESVFVKYIKVGIIQNDFLNTYKHIDFCKYNLHCEIKIKKIVGRY